MERGRNNLLFTALTVLLALPALADDFKLERIGRFSTGIFDESAAEIVAYDPTTQRLFVSNDDAKRIDILDISDPEEPTFVGTIDLSSIRHNKTKPTSVAFRDGLGAAVVKNKPVTDEGFVVFFDSDGTVLKDLKVGALPDAVTFTPDGSKVLVANEGEPNDDYTVDPEGSVSIIDVSGDISMLFDDDVKTVNFTAFNSSKQDLLDAGVRIFGPGATVAQDLEPESIAVTADSSIAWVTLQENNAIGVLDIDGCTFTDVLPLGFKNHLLLSHGLDASNKDDAINIATWPVNGMYQPDGIASFQFEGKTFFVTANEGDARDFDGFSEEERVKDLTLGGVLAIIPDLQAQKNLGRLKITTSPPEGKEVGAGPGGGDVFNKLFSYGARSFSIWTTDGGPSALELKQIFDSGDQLEQITAKGLEKNFNSNNDEQPSGDGRSDDKGPEPEAVVVGTIGSHTFAFIGLERVGGIMVYDISNPFRPCFVKYVNNRKFGVEFDLDACGHCEVDCAAVCAGDPGCVADCVEDCEEENCPVSGKGGRDPRDLGPEGLLFIPADESPDDFGPLLVVANEVSGSTTIFEIESEDDKDLCAELDDD